MLADCVFVRMIQRHEYEEQLLHARRMAEEANTAKAKFLSMMSHDLRTPLTTIYGHAELLAVGMHGTLSPEQREDVEIIRDACRVLSRMIGDVLDFAKLESGRVRIEPATVPLARVIERAETLVRMQLADSGLTFETGGFDDTTAVTADPDRLQQVLLNLVTNAIKFTPPGGKISVIAERDGDTVRIHVRDTGIGIASADLGRIFSPFVQLDPAGQFPSSGPAPRGVGLGLAISRDLARAMNGDVSVRSEPGEGSTFTISLPAARGVQERAGALPST